jgi:hypothetical protein
MLPPFHHGERDLPAIGDHHVELDAPLLEHVELFATFLGLAEHVTSLEVGVAGSVGQLL